MSVTMSGTESAASAPPRAAARGAALGRLTLTEFRLFLRERIGPIWGVGFPLVLLIIFGSIPSFSRPQASLGGFTVLDVYVPILIAFVIAMLALNVLPPVLAGYREKGILRRLQTTPVGPVRVLAAQLVIDLAVVAVMLVLILAVARIGYGVALPRQLGRVRPRRAAGRGRAAGHRPVRRRGRADRPGRPRDRGDPVLPDDVLRRAVAADRPDARRPAAHQPRHPARRRGAGPAGQRPGPLAAPAAAADPGRLRGGVRAGRG